MVRVLFYDSTLDTNNRILRTPKLIEDYFDIEAQKVLKYLRFSFKRLPQLATLNTIDKPFTFTCDVRNPKLTTTMPDKAVDRPCVIYSCYS